MAYRRGTILKFPCCRCCNPYIDSQMHHADYDKPHDVIWLCRPCHLAEHKMLAVSPLTFADLTARHCG